MDVIYFSVVAIMIGLGNIITIQFINDRCERCKVESEVPKLPTWIYVLNIDDMLYRGFTDKAEAKRYAIVEMGLRKEDFEIETVSVYNESF